MRALLSIRLITALTLSAWLMVPSLAQQQNVLEIDPNPQGFEIEAPRAPKPFGSNHDEQPANDLDQLDVPAERITDASRLPDAVSDMRTKLLEAARSGDIRKLARLVDPGASGTQLTILTNNISGETSEPAGDAIDYLESAAQDPSSIEALAILIDILELDPVLFAAGTADETYVWPWFWARSPSDLTPEETVELLRVVTWFDLEEMQAIDTYTFYRLGIAPDGRWRFFISGD
ncbi:MAG: hypothetical protein AAFY73_10745 [Pseudomonadota bacterium]